MVVALLLLAVGIGSVLFHFLSPWWWTPIASNWGYIDNTIIITFWITGAVFVAVVLVHGLLRLPLPARRDAAPTTSRKTRGWKCG